MKLRRIYSGVILFILLLMCGATVTYAWLNLVQTGSVDDISIEAVNDSLLFMSIDGGTSYHSVITNDMIRGLILYLKFSAMSSPDGETFYGYDNNLSGNSPNRSYLSLTIYFRTIYEGRKVYIADNLPNSQAIGKNLSEAQYNKYMYITSDGVAVKSDRSFRLTEDRYIDLGDEYVIYAADTMRLSSKEMINELNPLDTRDPSELHSFIFDTSEDESMGFAKPWGCLSYFMGMGLTPPATAPETLYKLTSYISGTQVASDESTLVTDMFPDGTVDNQGRPYYYGKARINVYSEGWDANSISTAVSDKIHIKLLFILLMPPGSDELI